MGVSPETVSIVVNAGSTSDIIKETVSNVPVIITPVVTQADTGLSVSFNPTSQPLTNGEASFLETVSVASSVEPGSTLKALVDFQLNGQSIDKSFIQTLIVTVPKHETSLVVPNITAPSDANGSGICTVSATLTDKNANGAPISGATIQFDMPLGFTPVRGNTGVTNSIGVATCDYKFTGLKTTHYPISASYAGNASVKPSQGTGDCLIYTMVSNGAYVIGDKNAKVGAPVTFWGSSWSSNNQMSQTQYLSPNFEGYATSYSEGNYQSTVGDSASSRFRPVRDQLIGVLVANSERANGSIISGTYVNIAIVKVVNPPGDGASPAGTGTVIQYPA